MAVGEGYSFFVSIFLFVIVTIFIPKQNNVSAKRIGGDPGWFGWRTLPAKIRFLVQGHTLVNNQYNESKEKNYHLQSTNVDRLVLAPKYLQELRMLNAGNLSASVASVENTIGEFSGVDIILKDRQSNDICRGRLTKSLPKILPILAKELSSHLAEELEDCNETLHTPCVAYKLVFSLNETASSIILVGPSLSRNKEWRAAFSEIQPAIASVILCLTPLPNVVRRLIGPFIPPVKRLRSVHAKIRRFMFPASSKILDPEFPTILQHYVETSKIVNEQDIVAKFCILSTSAIHTVTNAVTHALFELCTRPDHVVELRKELEEELLLNDGNWDFDVIKKLARLDSFLKESQRCNPPSYLSFNRVVMSDLKLSDGLFLPKGQFISFPAGPMARDPEYHQNPEIFDGHRFYKTESEVDEGTAQHELAGIEHGNLHWGNGRFTCPGRWYASAVMKLMIGLILLDYDVQFPDGQTERLPDAYLDTMIQPNDKQVIWMRKRK